MGIPAFLLNRFLRFWRGGELRLQILADDTQCFIIAAGAGDPLKHLIGLFALPGLFQQPGGPAQDAEDISVVARQRHFWFCQPLLLDKTAQPVGHIVAEPGSAKLFVRLEPPHGQPSHIQRNTRKGKQQVGQAIVLEAPHSFGFPCAAGL